MGGRPCPEVARNLVMDKLAGVFHTAEDESNKKWALAAKIGLPLTALAAGSLLLRSRGLKAYGKRLSKELSDARKGLDKERGRWADELKNTVSQLSEKWEKPLEAYRDQEKWLHKWMKETNPVAYEDWMKDLAKHPLPGNIGISSDMIENVASNNVIKARDINSWRHVSPGPWEEEMASAIRTNDRVYALNAAKKHLKSVAEDVRLYHPYAPSVGGKAPVAYMSPKDLEELLHTNRLYDITRAYAPEYMKYLPKEYVKQVEDWYAKNNFGFDNLDRIAETIKPLFG